MRSVICCYVISGLKTFINSCDAVNFIFTARKFYLFMLFFPENLGVNFFFLQKSMGVLFFISDHSHSVGLKKSYFFVGLSVC